MQRQAAPVRTETSLRIFLLTSAAMLCFAANSILCRLALAPRLIDPATFTSLRVLSAAAILVVVVWLRQRRLPKLARAEPVSIACLFAYFLFFSLAYQRLDAGSGALVLIGAVQLAMLSVAFWEGERFSVLQWAGLVVAVSGFLYLVVPGAAAPDPLGAVLMALSGVAWGCFSLLARSADDPVEINAVNLIGCLLPAAAFSAFATHDFSVTISGMLIAVVSGGVATGLGYILWYLALRGLPATHSATVQLSVPALVALGGILVLSEPITARVAVASALMLGGIGFVLAQGRRRF